MSLYLGENLISGNKPINLGVRNIGEIVASSLPLTDAGLHLLDGSLILGGGIYQGFVDYIADLYDSSTKTSNVTKVGSLTDNNGVLSGFSTNNYAKLPNKFTPSTNTWEMVFKINTGDLSANGCPISNATTNSMVFTVTSSGNFALAVSSNGTSWDIINSDGTYTATANTDYYIRIKYTGSAYTLEYSTDGTNYITDITVTSSSPIYQTFTETRIGVSRGSTPATPFVGSIDLNESYININGQRWWTGANPSFMTDEPQWQQSVTTYGVCGKFVYDSVNNTVRLPKVTCIIEGTTDLTALGDLVEAGLPNITGQHYELTSKLGEVQYSGAFYQSGTGTNQYRAHNSDNGSYPIINFDASRSSSIYGNSSTVQPQTIKAFYYIVIANSTKTEIQSDIDEIATDLNGKADVDLSNINASQSAKNIIVNWGMPDYTSGVSITSYTSSSNKFVAPCDGVIIWGHSCAKNDRGYLNGIIFNSYGVNDVAAYTSEVIPINKGENFYATTYRDSNSLCNNFFPLKGVN